MIQILKLSEKKKFIDYVDEKIVNRLEVSRNFFIALGERRYFTTFRYIDNSEAVIYADEDNFIICTECKAIIKCVNEIELKTNGRLQLYDFFLHLTADDVDKLQKIEKQITDFEDNLLIDSNPDKDAMMDIISIRRRIRSIKRYYVQMEFMTDELAAIDPAFGFIDKKFDRLLDFVIHLQEYIEQVRETYQQQLDFQQNNLMKIFTVVTTIFLPLTLIVGWYGMNFMMPEFGWKYGYPVIIGVSTVIVIGLLVLFKKKKWF